MSVTALYPDARRSAPQLPHTQGVRGLRLRDDALKSELLRSGYKDRWRDLSDYYLPNKSRFREEARANDGRLRGDLILDSTATQAIRTLRSGMMSGITSPARPWFRLSAPDPEMNDYGPVRQWLYTVQRNMEWLFSNTNLYKVLPSVYESLAVFGPAVVAMVTDVERVLRFEEFAIGSFRLALGVDGRIDTCYRDIPMTVRQIVEKFGIENCSKLVQQDWQQGILYRYHDVIHVIEPRDEKDRYPGSALGKFKRWKSCWYEQSNGEADQYLRESGFDRFPLLTPRWESAIESPYGYSLGGETLPDVKQLQAQQLQKLKGIDKMIDPPTQGPVLDSLDTLPGGHTAVPLGSGEGVRSIYDVKIPLGDLREDMEQTRQRIRKGLFEDLFLMLTQIDRAQITAFEIAERKEEKLLQLGPVLESINDDLLDPLVKNTFAEMQQKGLIPPPPDELRSVGKLRIEYISILHQAQRAVGVSAVDRIVTMALGMAQAWPEVIDKINPDEVIDDVAERLGTPPSIVRSEDEVEAVRDARSMAQNAMNAAAVAPGLGKAVKDLATAPMQTTDGTQTALGAAAKAVGMT